MRQDRLQSILPLALALLALGFAMGVGWRAEPVGETVDGGGSEDSGRGGVKPGGAPAASGPLRAAAASPGDGEFDAGMSGRGALRAGALVTRAREAGGRFAIWAEEFRKADPDDEGIAARLTGGDALALARRAAMKALIVSDPREALALAIPEQDRRELPGRITRHFEEVVRGSGDFRVTVADVLDGGGCEVRREATVDGRTYAAFVYGKRLAEGTRSDVRVEGIAVDGQLALRDSPDLLPEAGMGLPGGAWAGDAGGGGGQDGGAARGFTQGTKSLLFMPVAFADDPVAPISHSAATQLMQDVNQWFTGNSYQSTAIVADVTPLLVMPQTKAFYALQGVWVLQAAARAAALAAGFDTANYDFDIVNSQILGPPNFNFAGFATVGGKGLMLQVASLDVAVHELGHNFGLWHANFWSAPNDSVIGPGSTVEYGNPFDTMGSRTSNPGLYDFNAAFKGQLDWLPLTSVQTIGASGLYRLYAHDVPHRVGGRSYALRLRKDFARTYWVEFRQKPAANAWSQNGVLLNWAPWSNAGGNSLGGTTLLDTTPGTPAGNSGRDDAAVVIGRTFSDEPAGIHLTPVAKGSEGEDSWIDVQVHLGTFPGNAAPILELSADPTEAGVGVPVTFSAEAVDADGDPLAYAWDFGDASFGPNAPVATKSWSVEGEYGVRCTVSDMKGGTASRNLTIRVGSPATFRAGGRITTSGGEPVAGVRVHNGQGGTAYRGTFTDSEGRYVLVGLASGSHTLSAVQYGFTLAPAGWSNPVPVGPDAEGLDWIATATPAVTVSAADPHAAEVGGDTGTFVLTRTGNLATALTVKVNLSGSATYATDYTLGPAPVLGATLRFTLAAGAASAEIVLTPLGDSLAEGPETAVLSLLEDSAYTLGALAEATVTIADAQSPVAPTVSVTVPDNLAPETASDAGVFLISRSGSLAGDLAVRYAVGGTSVNGVDYTLLGGMVILPAGVASMPVVFHAIDDTEVEEDETVILTLLPDSAYFVGIPSSGTAIIVDDDPPRVTVTATDGAARENSGDTGRFTVTRIGDSSAILEVHYALGGTATNGVDYVALPGTVTVPASQTTASFTVVPLNDSIVEGTESVIATLLSAPEYNIVNPGEAVVLVTDDDSPGVTLTASDPGASEAGPDPGAFTFARTGATGEPLEVHFTVSGSAREGADFAPIGRSMVIPEGAASAVLTILPVDDGIKEVNETVALTLAESPNATYSVTTTAPRTVTISDNDAASLVGVGFTALTSSAPESQFLVEVGVSLSAPSPVAIVVTCEIAGGTAVNGVDYASDLPSSLFFPAGQVSKSVIIAGVNNNSVAQPDRTLVVVLRNPVNAQLDSPDSLTHTIVDDDGSGGTVTVSAIQPNASETGELPGTFRVSRSGGTTTDLPVQFQVTGTASSPSDFAPIGTSVVIPAGASHRDIVVTPVDDPTPEPTESVKLTLTGAANASIGTPKSATILIADNDTIPTLAGILAVTPADGGAASGPGGGPFDPPGATFALENVGDTPLDWSAGADADWLDVSLAGGILDPGAVADVSVTVNAVANALFPDLHNATITFTNTTNGNGTTSRHFLLSVRLPPHEDGQMTLTGDGVVLRFWGTPGTTYRIERSPDLDSWTPLGVLTAPANGILEWTDPEPPAERAFYQAVEGS